MFKYLVIDNWLEIMKHLDINLFSLALTCKYIYYGYKKYKSMLCHEGTYRFSPYQHQLCNDMMIHMNKDYDVKLPLLLQTSNNIGTKAAILSASLKYQGTVVIMCHKNENLKWQQEITKLYHVNSNILVFNATNQSKNIYLSHMDPNLLGYKIIIANKGNTWVLSKHSIVIIYRYHKVIEYFSNNMILFGGKSGNNVPQCEYIQYPEQLPILHVKNIYNTNIDNAIHDIILNYNGPYLIVGKKINTTHKLTKGNVLRSNDITFMKYNTVKINKSIKTIILLNDIKYIDDIINKSKIYALNIIHLN